MERSRMDWGKIQKGVENNVLRIECVRNVYDVFQPYLYPQNRKVIATGIVINNQFVLTNAHFVANAIFITGLTINKETIILTLHSICQERDLALCRIESVHQNEGEIGYGVCRIESNFDFNEIKFGYGVCRSNFDFNEIKFGHEVTEGEEVLTIGYQIDEITFTTGIISGIDQNIDPFDETKPKFIKITAALNYGSSGSPLINRKGELIGINTAGEPDKNFAIPISSFLSIYDNMISTSQSPFNNTAIDSQILELPKLSIRWNSINSAFLKWKNAPSLSGVYINTIYPDSCLELLNVGDILINFSFNDYTYTPHNNLLTKNNAENNKGNNKSNNAENNKGNNVEKRMSMKEVSEMIRIGDNIKLTLWRDDYYVLTTQFVKKDVYVRKLIYPKYQPYKYIIIAGLCLTELTENHIKELENKDKDKYKRYVIITYIFPQTTISGLDIFNVGESITKINSRDIETIDDIIVDNTMIIENEKKIIFVVDEKTMTNEDNKIKTIFNIPL